MYDPVLGAFVSVDPIMDLADPQQWNAYSYSNNNPTTWSDPTGKLTLRDPLLPPGGVPDPPAKKLPSPREQVEQIANLPNVDELPHSPEVMAYMRSYHCNMDLACKEARDRPIWAQITSADSATACNAERWATGKRGGSCGMLAAELGVGAVGGGLGKAGKFGDDAIGAVAKSAKATIDPGKFNYLFGKVSSGQHNTDRSLQNSRLLASVGVVDNLPGRELITEHLDAVVGDSSNILRKFSNDHGDFEIRESLFAGPDGFLKFESTWQLTDAGRRLTTSFLSVMGVDDGGSCRSTSMG